MKFQKILEKTIFHGINHLVTDAMQRESAIADDYWHTALQEAKRDPVEIKLHHMEEA